MQDFDLIEHFSNEMNEAMAQVLLRPGVGIDENDVEQEMDLLMVEEQEDSKTII